MWRWTCFTCRAAFLVSWRHVCDPQVVREECTCGERIVAWLGPRQGPVFGPASRDTRACSAECLGRKVRGLQPRVTPQRYPSAAYSLVFKNTPVDMRWERSTEQIGISPSPYSHRTYWDGFAVCSACHGESEVPESGARAAAYVATSHLYASSNSASWCSATPCRSASSRCSQAWAMRH